MTCIKYHSPEKLYEVFIYIHLRLIHKSYTTFISTYLSVLRIRKKTKPEWRGDGISNCINIMCWLLRIFLSSIVSSTICSNYVVQFTWLSNPRNLRFGKLHLSLVQFLMWLFSRQISLIVWNILYVQITWSSPELITPYATSLNSNSLWGALGTHWCTFNL